jgi:hypothetical protein
MAPDGSSWGYTDPLGQTWWASSYAVSRQTTVEHLARYALYSGWNRTTIEFEDLNDMVSHRRSLVAHRGSQEAANVTEPNLFDKLKTAVADYQEWPTAHKRTQVCTAALQFVRAVDTRAAMIEQMRHHVTPSEQALSELLPHD